MPPCKNAISYLFSMQGGFLFFKTPPIWDIIKFFWETMWCPGLNIAFGAEYEWRTWYWWLESQLLMVSIQCRAIWLLWLASHLQGISSEVLPAVPRFPWFPAPGNELSRGKKRCGLIFRCMTADFSVSMLSRVRNSILKINSDFGGHHQLLNSWKGLKQPINDKFRAALTLDLELPSCTKIQFLIPTSIYFDNQGNPQEVGTFANQ